MLKVSVIGRLGKDSIVKVVNEKTYVSFTLAVDPFRGSDETMWVEVMYRTNSENLVKYLVSGRQVFISGTPKLSVNTFNDQNTARMTVWADELELLGSTPQSK